LKSGPALIAMNGCPERVNETISLSLDGVLWIVVVFVIFESGNAEVYRAAASLASLSNHK